MMQCRYLSGLLLLLSAYTTPAQNIPSQNEPAALYRLTRSIVPSEFDFPMRHTPLLSANFGELRENHFHSGIDFKTEEVTGKPVYPAADGWVSRIGISIYGYGKAIYIDHPNGYTTVYGHLLDLSPRLDSILKTKQYKAESYVIQLYFTPHQIPVRKDEIIAYSGNTGGSGGPHLHFEVRDTKSEEPVDPLLWYADRLHDDVSPHIYSMALYAQPGMGIMSTVSSAKTASPIPSHQSQLIVSDTSSLPAVWGRIGLGFRVLDYMTGTTHNYGVCRATLSVDKKVIYQREMNRFSFNESRYINASADYGHWAKNKKWFMKTFRVPANHADIYPILVNDGYIDIDEERPYQICYEVSDRFGNTSAWTFSLKGRRMTVASVDTATLFLYPNHSNEIVRRDFRAVIDKNAFYDTIPFLYHQGTCKWPQSPIQTFSDSYCIIGNHVPCHTSVTVKMRIQHDIIPDKSRYYVARIEDDGSYTYEGGEYKDSWMEVRTRHFGTFTVLADTVVPKISLPDVGFAMKNSFLRIRISDEASGVAGYKVFLDGKWALFEDDYKNHSIFYRVDPVRFPSTGSGHVLKIKVWDHCGNEAIEERTFIY